MQKALLTALVGLLLAAPTFARERVPTNATPPDLDTAADRFQWYGESSLFSISIMGMEAIRAGIRVGHPSQDPEFGPVIPIDVSGSTFGFFNTVYSVNNRSLTLLSRDRGLLPRYIDSDFKERDYTTRLVGDFDRDNYTYTVRQFAADGTETRKVATVPAVVYDDLGMILDMRSREFQVGNSYVYYKVDGNEVVRITVVITGFEPVFSDIYGMVECAAMRWTVEPLEPAPMLSFGGQALPPVYRPAREPYTVATSFFSNDSRRLILGANIETKLGTMKIRLINHTPPSAGVQR